jgi:predicted Ser/Thr protein kinase
MPFIIGESVGPYRLVEQLGQGGMATVFKGYHARLERYVAIKALHPAFTEDSNFLGRFNREAKVVANLDHANIVPIFDYSEHEGRPYLVMKFIEGETLKARLTRNVLSLDEILCIVEKAGTALAYAHSQGVLHRDIKPSNVLLTGDGQVYLADFGLARIAAAGESSLTADRMVGTPQYMSPEQAVAKSDLDSRSDIYSFGVMLYEMIVGRVPFNADTPFAIIHDHIYTPLPLPRAVKPDVSEAVERVLLKALAKDPDDRFENMMDLVCALRNAILIGVLPEAVSVGLEPSHDDMLEPSLPYSGDFPAVSGDVPVAENSMLAEASGVDLHKKWRSIREGWRVALIFMAVIVLSFCCLITLGAFEDFRQKRQAELSADKAVLELLEEDSDLRDAEAALEDSLAHWREGDLDAVYDDVERMQILAKGNDVFYQTAFERMIAQQAWLVAVVTVADWPMDMLEPFTQEVRSIFYLAAKDRLSGPVWKEYGDHPYARIAKIRYELYYGDPVVAKDKLGKILEDPDLMKDYPEANLLEAEIHVHFGDFQRARMVLRDLIRTRELPAWIWDAMGNLSEQYDLQVPKPQE